MASAFATVTVAVDPELRKLIDRGVRMMKKAASDCKRERIRIERLVARLPRKK